VPAVLLRRVADTLTILGLIVLVVALVTTSGPLAVAGALLVAASVVLALVRRARPASRRDPAG
jgi:hypothetical protein